MRCVVVSEDMDWDVAPCPVYVLKSAKPKTVLHLDYDLKEALDEAIPHIMTPRKFSVEDP